MKLKVQLKSVYGNSLIYPICEKSKIFCIMLGRKTLAKKDFGYLKQLGYTFEFELPDFT